jgi:hypothetical protein
MKKSEETIVSEITALQEATRFLQRYDAQTERFLKGDEKRRLERACAKLARQLDKKALELASRHGLDTHALT